MIEHTKELMAYDGSEDRYNLCRGIEHESAALDNLPHADVQPHDWAIHQIDTEVRWLCSEWQPEHRLLVGEHAESLKETLDLYLESLQCQAGSVTCAEGGDVVGEIPHCACICKPGYGGDACETPICSQGCVEGDCIAPDHCECTPNVATGANCSEALTFEWVVGEWGFCPGHGRWAEREREIGCTRSDSIEATSELCEEHLRTFKLGMWKGLMPTHLELCCDPFTTNDLPYQECGIADDGCGGEVNFGSCDLFKSIDPDSPFAPVITELRKMLKEMTEVLRHGDGSRAAACASLNNAYQMTDNAEHFADNRNAEADEWALEQVDHEFKWLCTAGRGPMEEGEIKSHLAGMEEVYQMYITRISCMGEDIACAHGTVTGSRPYCECICEDGWQGGLCDERIYFMIRSPHDTQYCVQYDMTSTNAHMALCGDNLDNQLWLFDEHEQLISKASGCLDLNYNDNNVYIHACHGDSNQQWFFSEDALKSRFSGSLCLDWDFNNGNLYMHECHGGTNQMFSTSFPSNAALIKSNSTTGNTTISIPLNRTTNSTV